MGIGARVVAGILICPIMLSLWSTVPVSASGSWTTGTFTWGERETVTNGTAGQGCYPTSATVVGVGAFPEVGTVCIYQRPDFRYAIYHKQFSNWWGGSNTQSYFVVGLGTDQNLYHVENMGTHLPLSVPSSNDLHFNTLTAGFTNNHLLTYIPNFHTALVRSDNIGEPVKYQLQPGVSKNFIPSADNSPVTTGAVGISNNGRWMVVEVMGAGIVRLDTATRQIKAFSEYVHTYGVGSNANMTYLVTDDGLLVATFDYNVTPTVHVLTDGCGLDLATYNGDLRDQLRGRSCPSDSGRLQTAISSHYSNYYEARGAMATRFNTDGDTLYFVSYEYNDPADMMTPTIYQTPLRAGDFQAETQLEYLAIGDSFTSGEGDIEQKSDGSSYYLPGTEDLNECHVSSRSYPFLLRDYFGISSERMKSVACSGAQVLPDYIGSSQNYLGQANRISNKKGEALQIARENALELFSPGIIPQLEYIKRYQPNVLTVMGGGNDVGFGSILEYCASPTWQEIFVDATCGYAKEGHVLQAVLAQSIQSQYNYTLMLLRMIREYSPNTTVYVVGYPSFISESPLADCLNSGVLDKDERMMIHNGVSTMNAMLAAAAESSGVKYIDIQDSLHGGRLCEGSEYVTGILDVVRARHADEHEMFHPNGRAHLKIASRITSGDISFEAGMNSQPLPEKIAFNALESFKVADHRVALRQEMTKPIATEQTALELSMPAGSSAPNSEIVITMHSNPTNLGRLLSDGSGSVVDSVLLPDTLKPGRHVLLVETTSPSGEDITYYQFITLVSNQPGDADADGILDENDSCLFITSWVDETTGKDVCTVAVVNPAPDEQEEVPDDNELVVPENEETEIVKLDGLNTSNSVTSRNNRPNQEPRGNSILAAGEPVVTSSEGRKVTDTVPQENMAAQGEVKGASTVGSPTSASLLRWELYVFAVFAVLSTLLGGCGILKLLRSQA